MSDPTPTTPGSAPYTGPVNPTRLPINPQTGLPVHGTDDPWDSARAAVERQGRAAAASLNAVGPPAAAMLRTRAGTALANAQMVANSLPDAVDRIASDPMIPRESRRGLAIAEVQKTRDAIQSHLDSAGGDLKLLEGVLTSLAMPAVDSAREASLRQDLAVRLAGVPTTEIPTVLAGIAHGPDRALAALVAQGSLLDAHLSKLERRAADEARTLIRVSTLEGSRLHGNATQKKAAEARLTGLKSAQSELMGKRMLIEARLSDAESRIPRQ